MVYNKNPVGFLWIAFLLLLLSLGVDAFVIARPNFSSQRSLQVLRMSSDEGNSDMEAAAANEPDVIQQQQQQPPPPPEDPELTALKEEIAKQEATLKEKRRELAYTSDQADDFSQAGYARKVAEMENMRRAKSVSTIRARKHSRENSS